MSPANPQWLWFLSRGSGVVLLVLFTAVAVLGVATRTGWRPRRWPRFVSAELHRTLSLFAVGLLALHVVAAIADPYVSIGWAATVIPFLSPYRTLAGGASAPLGALLIGGYFGTWAAAADALRLPFSAAGLAAVGASPAAGVLAAMPATACGLAETARVARYLADSSAGQCGPCVFGLAAIARELEQAAAGGACDLVRVRRWLGDVTGRGACRHPDGAARMVASALRVFRAEIALHERGWCGAAETAGVLPVAGQDPS